MKALQKIITLEKLCRAMQNERALLHERLQELSPESIAELSNQNNQQNGITPETDEQTIPEEIEEPVVDQ